MNARTNDHRARAHPIWWTFLIHRLSGIALALFLPLHFLALGTALSGAAALDTFLQFVDRPFFKFGEWALTVLLAVHTMAGVRVILIEFKPWSGPRKNLIAAAAGCGVGVGLAFALALL